MSDDPILDCGHRPCDVCGDRVCSHCGEAIREIPHAILDPATGVHPTTEWVHDHNDNPACEVDEDGDPVPGSTFAKVSDRFCFTCGADILGDDPHEPGCERPSDYEWDHLPAEVRDRLDPGGLTVARCPKCGEGDACPVALPVWPTDTTIDGYLCRACGAEWAVEQGRPSG